MNPAATETASIEEHESTATRPVVDHTVSVSRQGDEAVETFFYGRASLDRSGARSSVTTQEGKYDHLATLSAWNTQGRFIDNDLSASKKKVTRPEFERMLRLIDSGQEPDLIVTNDVSRLLRNRRDKIRLEQLIERGVHIYDMRYGIDTREKHGRILFGIMAEMAIDRAQELAEYQRDYHDRRRREGRPSKSANGYGHTPLLSSEGHVIGFAVDEKAAPAIRWGVKQLLVGASLRSVVAAWSDSEGPHCLPRRVEGPFDDSTVRKIVCSARIAGCVEFPEYDPEGNLLRVSLVSNTDGTLPAIVPVEDVLALRERFKINGLLFSNGTGVGRTAIYLLSGIAECPDCRHALYGSRSSRKTKAGVKKIKVRYQCEFCRGSGRRAGRDGSSIDMIWLDEYVTGATFERLRSGALTEMLAQAAAREDVAETARQIAAEEDELRRFDELVDKTGDVSAERYLKFTQAKETRIARLKAQLAAELDEIPEQIIPTLPDDLLERLEEYWEEADLEWKRRLIRLCWEQVVVHRAPRRGRLKLEEALERIELVPRDAAVRDEADLPRAA